MSIIPILFCYLEVINLLPSFAALVPSQLSALYGVAPEDKVLTPLLQHRTILFGLVDAAFVAAAFIPNLRWAALIGGSARMIAFMIIAGVNGELTGPLQKPQLLMRLAFLPRPFSFYS